MNRPRDREQALDRWLKRSGTDLTPPTGACLDPETAAAWADAALNGESLERAQQHVADCARCQALMAMLTETVVAAGHSDDALQPSAWRRWLTWIVPITAAATALIAIAVWVNVPAPAEPPSRSVAPRPDAVVAAPPREPQAFAPAEPRPGAASTSAATAPQQPLSTAPRPGADDQVSSGAAAARKAVPPGSPPATTEAREDSTSKDVPNATSASAQATVPPASPAAAPEPTMAGGRTAPRTLSAQAGAASAETVAPGPTLDRLMRQPPAIEITSPVATVRWRVLDNVVERTVDGGTTWTAAQTGVQASIAAGSAPSPMVCWLVGRGGVVLVTTDGVRWSLAESPAAVDFVAVSAADARRATVTAADGRQFRTEDGGRSWK